MSEFVVPREVTGIRWSWSVLKLFRSCPRAYEAEKVRFEVKSDFKQQSLKELLKKQRERPRDMNALDRGSLLHLIMDMMFTDPDMEPPSGFEWIMPLVRKVRSSLRDIRSEVSLCLGADLQPVAWRGPRNDWLPTDRRDGSWLYAKVDLIGYRPDGTLSIVDWKTGRVWPDGQPGVMAAAFMAANPDIERVETSWIWVEPMKDGKPPHIERDVYTREDALIPWEESMDTLKEIAAYRRTHADKRWPHTPGGWCRFCKVTNCVHQGKDY